MNKRIQELAIEAGYTKDMAGIGHWDMPECKKFVKLIIQECAEFIAPIGDYCGGHGEPSALRSVKCRVCGFENLKWIETSNGWRTAYSSGLLAGKVHACGGGI